MTLIDLGEVDGASAINRRALRRLTREPISVDMNVKVVPDTDRSLLSILVSCSYRAVIGLIRERLLVCTAVATFEVENLASHIEENGQEKLLPTPLMMNMLGIAVGAVADSGMGNGFVTLHQSYFFFHYRFSVFKG